jgi:glucose-1-phosphate thymidylyltransferase
VYLINSTVGPNVSLGKGCHVTGSTIKNSLIQTHAHISNANLDNAMIEIMFILMVISLA